MPDPLPTIEQVAAQLEKDHSSQVPAPEVEAPAEESEVPVEVAPVESEIPVEQPKPEVKKEGFLASKFAALSRKEKEVRQKIADAETRQRELEGRSKSIEERELAIKAAKRPLDILKAHGFTYNDATTDALGGYTPKEDDPADVRLGERLSPLEEKLKKLEEANKTLSDQLGEVTNDRRQRALQEVEANIRKTADENGYELISSIGNEAYRLVQDVIRDYFHKHQRVLTYDEACATVEEYYTTQYVTPLAKTKKMQALFTSAAPAASPAIPEKKEAPSSNTLTQRHSSPPAKSKSGVDHLSKHDALAELAKMLRYDD